MASQNINVGTDPDDGNGESLRSAFIDIRKMFAEVYGQTYTSDTQDLGGTTFEIDSDRVADGAIDTVHIADDQITHDKLEDRYTEDVSITTYTGTVSFDCSNGSVFKLGGDLSGAYTVDLTGYKKGQIITIYPLKGNQTLNLDAQGTSTNTFNKIGGVDYEDDGSSNNILQIECVDDSSTDPVFFYSLSTYASASSDI